MEQNALEEFRDDIRQGTKSTIFQILTEIHTELIEKPHGNVIQYFWKCFRLVGYFKIKCAADLYLLLR